MLTFQLSKVSEIHETSLDALGSSLPRGFPLLLPVCGASVKAVLMASKGDQMENPLE